MAIPKARFTRILGQDENITGYIVLFEHDGSVHLLTDVTPASGLDATLGPLDSLYESTVPSVANRTTSSPIATILLKKEKVKDIEEKDIETDKDQNMGN